MLSVPTSLAGSFGLHFGSIGAPRAVSSRAYVITGNLEIYVLALEGFRIQLLYV